MSWSWLPLEIRYMILGNLAPSQTHNGLGYLAVVCREWHNFFDPWIFKQLVLDESKLPALKKAIDAKPIRVAAIQEILYRVKLLEYKYPECITEETCATTRQNEEAVTRQIISLLEFLSPWKTLNSEGISLRLSVTSRSDNRHAFFFPEEEEDYQFQFAGDLQKSPNLLEYHSIKKDRPQDMCDLTNHFKSGLLRLLGRTIGRRSYPWSIPIPVKVSVVKELVIRRHHFRSMSLSFLQGLVLSSLTDVRSLRFERRDAGNAEEQSEDAIDILNCLLDEPPPTLRKLSLTQWIDFGQEIQYWPSGQLRQILKSGVGCGPWILFNQLTEFAASAFMCGDTILNYLSQPGLGENLEVLCLSPSSFNHNLREEIMHTIQNASNIVTALPKLRVMELWGIEGSYRHGYIFRYRMDERRQPSITWSTCDASNALLDSEAEKSWLDAAAKLGARLEIHMEPLKESESSMIATRGQIMLRNLELRELLLHPITLAEIEASATNGTI